MLSRLGSLFGLTFFVALIGWVDIATGADFGMSLFYLVPVAIAAWMRGRTDGLLIAGLAAIAWYVSELHGRGVQGVAVTTWNGASRAVIFGGAALLLSSLRTERERLKLLLAEANALARTDPLTGLANRHAFDERLQLDVLRATRVNIPIVIAYLDLDHFKAVNDRFGHAAGDAVLRDVARVLRGTTREGDIAARIGGDEFVVALWSSGPAGAAAFEERVTQNIAELAAAYPETQLGVSIGTIVLAPGSDADSAVRAADAAMYAAKSARRPGPPR